jgi:hypothetical protein
VKARCPLPRRLHPSQLCVTRRRPCNVYYAVDYTEVMPFDPYQQRPVPATAIHALSDAFDYSDDSDEPVASYASKGADLTFFPSQKSLSR